MRIRTYFAVSTILVLVACGKEQVPTAPSGPTPTPPPPAGPTPGPLAIGTALDTAFQRLAGVHVEIVDGPAAGAAATSGADGQFALPVSLVAANSDFTVRATKAGYVTILESHHWYGTPYGVFFSPALFLAPTESPMVFEPGAYSVTLDFPCTGIPADVRTHTFAATVTPSPIGPTGVGFRVVIDDTHFSSSSFRFGVAGRHVGVPFEVLMWEAAPFRYFEAGFGQDEKVIAVAAEASAFSIPANFEYCELNSQKGPRSGCFNAPAAQVITREICYGGRLTLRPQ